MITPDQVRKSFWQKNAFWTVGILLYLTILYAIINWLFGTTIIHTTPLFILAALILITIPFIGTKLVKWKYNLNDIEKFEKQFEEHGYSLLIDAFGKKEYEKMLHEKIGGVNLEGVQNLKKLLTKEETESNKLLKFYICSMLGKLLYKDKQYNNAIEYLKEALAINPLDYIVNLRLAVVFEYLGNSDSSLQAYNSALKDPSVKSPQLKDYVLSQISRVKSKGPRKGPPHPGLGYLPW